MTRYKLIALLSLISLISACSNSDTAPAKKTETVPPGSTIIPSPSDAATTPTAPVLANPAVPGNGSLSDKALAEQNSNTRREPDSKEWIAIADYCFSPLLFFTGRSDRRKSNCD